MRVIWSADINHVVTEKKFITIKNYQEVHQEKISDIDNQELFPDLSSSGNIWNMYDDESDEEESSSNDYTRI